MERVVNSGPVEPTILKLQSDHRSEWLWREKLAFDLCVRPIKIEMAWTLLTSHPPHQRVEECLSSARLYNVVRVADIFGRGRPWRAMLQALTGYDGPINDRSFVWCWERMLPLQPGLYESEDDDVVLPYAMRWTKGVERKIEPHHTLIAIRDQIDHMTEAHILKISLELQKDPAHALWRHEIESMVKQTFEETRDAIPPDGPFVTLNHSIIM
ncbi:hypothetical protein FXO38_31276 [Capsicum annuum]|uniref:Uncharacterized protein n=1 Tax=Capsicum annuum TaxID=4072 RepID=A0A2G2ZWZ6_CAPAN|nr:hypothetical protein FXO38_31276 [Capsicum annuum]KAF3636279.1 hypothetical protein FXO37_25504 [Capsicum annuum]PHT86489.1 hypothetical protein T459_08595 [Capsicum annuum]